MFKRRLISLVALLLVFSLTACGGGGPTHYYCELVIPLSDDFVESDSEQFDVIYTNGECAVGILRISFQAAIAEGITDTLSARAFGLYYANVMCERDVEMQKHNKVDYCTYYDGEGALEHYYLEAFFRSDSAYFVVLFATLGEKASLYENDFLTFISGVYFLDKPIVEEVQK